MKLAEQKECLRMLVELEQKNYIQEKTAEALRCELESIAEKRNFIAPVKMRRGHEAGFKGIVTMVCGAAGIISAGAGFFCEETLYKFFFWVAGILMLWLGIAFFREYQQEVEQAKAVYQARLARYHLKVEAEENRRTEEQQRKKRLQEAQKNLLAAAKQTKAEKEELYARVQIPEQYRGYIPVCMLLQYLLDGTCGSLDGEGGAYSCWDKDETILRDWNSVKQKMKEVKMHQPVLYASLTDADRRIKDTLKTMQSTAEPTT